MYSGCKVKAVYIFSDDSAIFKNLNRKKINYIVVGGLAVNLHGIPRMTYDMDLLLEMNDSNLRKFITLVKKWGFKPKIPVNIIDFAKEEIRKEWINKKHMKAFNFVTG